MGSISSHSTGKLHGIDAAHLAGAHPNQRQLLGQYDGVRLHMFHGPPSENEIGKLVEGRLSLRDHVHGPLGVGHHVPTLHEEPTVNSLEVEWRVEQG